MPTPEAFVTIDLAVDVAPYLQIVAQLRAAIDRGALHAGDELPSVRRLAADLGVAPNTVARAYGELRDAGWLAGDERTRTRVAGGVAVRAKRARTAELASALDAFVATLAARGYAESEIVDGLRRRLAHGR